MTDQHHPLTNKICRQVSGIEDLRGSAEMSYMRSAADWQLEQVIEWMKLNLMKHDFHEGYAYLYDDCSNAYIREEELLKDLQEEMRPTKTQEDN